MNKVERLANQINKADAAIREKINSSNKLINRKIWARWNGASLKDKVGKLRIAIISLSGFQQGLVLSPRAQLAISDEICSCRNWGRGATGI